MSQNKIQLSGDLIGLDLGASRCGVARISTKARIPEPLDDINMSDSFVAEVSEVVQNNSAQCVVVGLPRGLDGQITEQTKFAEDLIGQLSEGLAVPVFTIDEAGTTKTAEERAAQGQSIDGVAAGIILEDFVNEVQLGKIENVQL